MAGLKTNQVRQYWDERIQLRGSAGTSLAGSTPERARRDYAARRRFIFKHVPVHAATLDYGCGAGDYAGMFRGPYMGVDVCLDLVNVARERHPDLTFLRLPLPTLPYRIADFKFDLVFTATVLQHNDEDSVRAILQSIRVHNPAPSWAIYENMDDNSPTVCGRTPLRYIELLQQEGFPIGKCETRFHQFHGAAHGLAVVTP